MRVLKLTVEYEGTAYQGWQFQPSGPTLQGILEEKLAIVTREKVRIMGAGRTDSGVHALGQVATFKTECTQRPEDLRRSLNALLPRDVSVLRVEYKSLDFDARRSSRGKRYRYQLWNEVQRSVFQDRFAWHVRKPLDLPAMRRAAELLVGNHDYSAFRAADCQARTATRVIWRLDVDDSQAPLLCLHIEATAFLKHMVRNLAGTLVAVGQGKRDAESMATLLQSRDRTQAGCTAPAQGLFLVEVFYED